jgi:hypothetical protein
VPERADDGLPAWKERKLTYAFQDQDNRRAGGRGLTRNHGGLARCLRRAAVGVVCAAAVAVPLAGAATAQAATSAPHALTSSWTSLTPQNGWVDYGNGTASPAVTNISGIVHLKGAIATSGTNPVPFTLPVGDRPANTVFVPVDLNGATAGSLEIDPSGLVTVGYEQSWSDAQGFTGLDGVSFATSGSSFTPLTLQNGWINYGFGMASPAVRSISGIVHLRGLIKTGGTNPLAFTLPAGFRPNHVVYVSVILCGGNNGRLDIYPNGEVFVEAEGGTWSHVVCGTSLDGVWFAKSASLYTPPLTLQNGWASYGSSTASPAVRKISGIVRLEGAMSTSGTNPLAFTLPAGFRPAHNVYVSVDTDLANRGHILIDSNGQVTVFPEGGVWTNASSFTSLDGVSFAP